MLIEGAPAPQAPLPVLRQRPGDRGIVPRSAVRGRRCWTRRAATSAAPPALRARRRPAVAGCDLAADTCARLVTAELASTPSVIGVGARATAARVRQPVLVVQDDAAAHAAGRPAYRRVALLGRRRARRAAAGRVAPRVTARADQPPGRRTSS